MTSYASLDQFLKQGRAHLAQGPVALVLAEDGEELESTLLHHLDCGFRAVVLLAPARLSLSPELTARVHRVTCDTTAEGALTSTVNAVARNAAPGCWLYYCYNAEYLFYPFREHRSVGEMLTFHSEERRDAMLTYVVDLYAGDLEAHPTAISHRDAHLDRSGYYARQRTDAWNNPLERQLDFYGGLRWRFEEHVPPTRRRIDRISLFRAAPGLRMNADHTFNLPEYNTYACPWHHSLTAAVCSFRAAKALKRNPASTFDIRTFRWRNSVPFEWRSQQLMDLGLMEPGQWF